MKHSFPTISLFDLSIYSGSSVQLFKMLEDHLLQKNSELMTVCTPNPEQIMLSRRDIEFKHTLMEADLLIPDGIGLVFAQRILHQQEVLKQRIPGRSVVARVLDLANTHKLSVLFIGGKENTAKEMVRYCEQRYPQIQSSSDIGFEHITRKSQEEQDHLLHTIQSMHPDIVFVAFGAPYQEEWIITHKQILQKHGVKLAMVVGGTYDILLERVPKVPTVMESIHLEWFWRLIQEPTRITRQVWLIAFVFLVLQQKLQDIFKQK